MIHSLKCAPQYFAALLDGSKTFEIRRNDRDYKQCDTLLLHEVDSLNGATILYTGRTLIFDVTYVTTDPEFVLPGFAVLGGSVRRSAAAAMLSGEHT